MDLLGDLFQAPFQMEDNGLAKIIMMVMTMAATTAKWKKAGNVLKAITKLSTLVTKFAEMATI